MAALIVERRRSLERDHGQLLDVGVVASLEHDAARSRDELVTVQADTAAIDEELTALETDEAAFATERRGAIELTEHLPGASAASAAAEVRGELRSRRASLERAEAELRRAGDRAAELGRLAVDAEQRAARFRHDCDAAELVETPLVDDIARAEARLQALQADHDAAVEARQRAAEQASAGEARVDAFRLALDAVHARAGAERLAGLDGVLGTLLDLVGIDAGLGASRRGRARRGARRPSSSRIRPRRRGPCCALRASDTTGAVLALGLRPTADTPPDGGDPVRPHVSASRVSVGALVDRLLATAVRVDDVTAAAELAAGHPDAVVVTGDGDRFALGGWRLGAAAAGGVTAAALDDAVATAERMQHEVERRSAALREAAAAVSAARRHLDDLQARLASNDALLDGGVRRAGQRAGRARPGRWPSWSPCCNASTSCRRTSPREAATPRRAGGAGPRPGGG